MNTDFVYQLPFDNEARERAVAKAERWTRNQAERLDTTTDVILAAIRERCWLPEQIAAVSSRYVLEGLPPLLAGVLPIVDARIAKWSRSRVKRKLAA